MIQDRRHVRTLRLQGSDGRAIARGHALVREALARSSFRGDGLPGRLLIRSLELPVIDRDDSAEALAGACSRALERAWNEALPLAAPGAERAVAVRVASELEPWVELARRACRPAPFDVSGWFWPLLVAGLEQRGDRAHALDLAITALCVPRGGLPALAATLGLLVEEGIAEPLLEALTRARAGALLVGLGLAEVLGDLEQPAAEVSAPIAHPSFEARAPDALRTGQAPPEVSAARAGQRSAHAASSVFGTDAIEPAWRRLLRAFVARWGVDDPRSAWLCHCALWVQHPSRMSGPNVAGSVRRLMQRAVLFSEHELLLVRSATSSVASGGPPGSAAPGAEPSPASCSTASEPAAAAARAMSWEAPLPSEFSGLYFIVAILGRLGIEAFLEEHPALTEVDLPCRLFARLADRLEVPLDDVSRRPLGGAREDRDDVRFLVPEAWFGALIEARVSRVQRLAGAADRWLAIAEPGLPVASWQGPPPPRLAARLPADALESTGEYRASGGIEVLLDAWERALSLWLARWTELDCRALVRRPGRVAITRTHVDIFFDLNQADVRVRRAALDINPGYVWYLGRIVTFHYTT